MRSDDSPPLRMDEESDVQSGLVDSPLRQALNHRVKTPPSTSASTPIVNNSTPILTASLNSPPTSINNNCDDTAMYANLLMQLRKQQGPQSVKSAKLSSSSINNRKEKLKTVNCYQCPVCFKRFQRHIAMNAHFQSEHVIHNKNREKVCRLCSATAADISEIRLHLLTEHRIDLKTPAACMVEATETSTAKSPVLRASLSSPPKEENEDDDDDHDGKRNAVIIEDGSPHDLTMRSNVVISAAQKRKRTAISSNTPWQCIHCQIIFPNQTLYFLHKGFHSDVSDPWRCNGCGITCSDMYDFNTHLMSDPHN